MKLRLSFFCLSVIAFISCNKEPGQGGTSSITGKVYVYDLSVTGLDTLDEFYAPDEDVYIIYGDDTETYSEKFATSYDGSYRFDNLTKGKYTIFTYSKCPACPNETEVKKLVLDITENKTEYELGDIEILK